MAAEMYWVNAGSGVIHRAGCQYAPWDKAVWSNRTSNWWGPYFHIGAAIGAAVESTGKAESCWNLGASIDVKLKSSG